MESGTDEGDVKAKNGNSHQHNICAPIKTLSELWTFLETPPNWIKCIVHLAARSNFVIQNDLSDCHVESYKFVPKIRLDQNFVPKTLVCHDMKNGYLEDKYVGPINIGNGYTFYHWSQIDIFVYFSHHLITIPPLSWINVAHKNGVPILGTFITEWKEGAAICDSILHDLPSVHKFANALIDICMLFKLDGWFINIENAVKNPENLREFVRYLTDQLHERKPGSKVIWYDSVTISGELKWQNELNELNRDFFDICDGIFLNYTWKENNLETTVKSAQHRILDVYVGVDIFGRGSFGGGKFNSHIAAEAIRSRGLSLAIFAQGWTHETLDPEPQDDLLERFYIRDNAFWKSLRPYLYTHPLKYVFETFFHTGVDKEWYVLEKQGIQLSKILISDREHTESQDTATLRGTCNCLQLYLQNNFTSCHVTNEQLDETKSFIHHLLSCEIQINSKFVLYTYTKDMYGDIKYDFSIILLIHDMYGCVRKIICHSGERHIDGSNSTVIELFPSRNLHSLNVTPPKEVPDDWQLRCFSLDLGDLVKILEIGITIPNGRSICLCGMGIKVNN